MRILILEDDTERIKSFMKTLPDDFVVAYVDTVTSAVGLLQYGGFDVLFLDHDLGGETYVSVDNKNTGSELCRWLAESPVLKQTTARAGIVIHSMNPIGATEMERILKDAEWGPIYRLPFPQLRDAIEEGRFFGTD